ncbi:MAG: hypothetical protein ACK2U1_19290 [Anaerolineales bacterium]|jgi:transcription elongation factor Elf1
MKHDQKAYSKKETVECLACDEEVYVGKNPKIGNFVTCHHCDATFQIIDIEPVLIDWPYDEDDEFEDYEDYSDDDEGYYDEDYDD